MNWHDVPYTNEKETSDSQVHIKLKECNSGDVVMSDEELNELEKEIEEEFEE